MQKISLCLIFPDFTSTSADARTLIKYILRRVMKKANISKLTPVLQQHSLLLPMELQTLTDAMRAGCEGVARAFLLVSMFEKPMHIASAIAEQMFDVQPGLFRPPRGKQASSFLSFWLWSSSCREVKNDVVTRARALLEPNTLPTLAPVRHNDSRSSVLV